MQRNFARMGARNCRVGMPKWGCYYAKLAGIKPNWRCYYAEWAMLLCQVGADTLHQWRLIRAPNWHHSAPLSGLLPSLFFLFCVVVFAQWMMMEVCNICSILWSCARKMWLEMLDCIICWIQFVSVIFCFCCKKEYWGHPTCVGAWVCRSKGKRTHRAAMLIQGMLLPAVRAGQGKASWKRCLFVDFNFSIMGRTDVCRGHVARLGAGYCQVGMPKWRWPFARVALICCQTGDFTMPTWRCYYLKLALWFCANGVWFARLIGTT